MYSFKNKWFIESQKLHKNKNFVHHCFFFFFFCSVVTYRRNDANFMKIVNKNKNKKQQKSKVKNLFKRHKYVSKKVGIKYQKFMDTNPLTMRGL